jgi:hypothetical protein
VAVCVRRFAGKLSEVAHRRCRAGCAGGGGCRWTGPRRAESQVASHGGTGCYSPSSGCNQTGPNDTHDRLRSWPKGVSTTGRFLWIEARRFRDSPALLLFVLLFPILAEFSVVGVACGGSEGVWIRTIGVTSFGIDGADELYGLSSNGPVDRLVKR